MLADYLDGQDIAAEVSRTRMTPCATASPSSALVSESVHDALCDDFAFGAVREVELKGFSGTHRVYPVELAA